MIVAAEARAARIPDPPPPTRRLAFRRWDIHSDTDRLAYFLMFADPAVVRYIDPERRYPSVAAMTDMLAKDPPFDRWGYGFWVVSLRISGETVGTCGFKRRDMQVAADPDEHVSVDEFGYLYKRKFWGQGLATEAAQAVTQWADAAGIEQLWARVIAENTPSVRVLQGTGFTYVQDGPPCPEGRELILVRNAQAVKSSEVTFTAAGNPAAS